MSFAKECIPFVVVPALVAALLFVFAPGAVRIVGGGVFTVVTLFCLFFFRDPDITITQGEENILSPCNGTVMEISDDGGEKVARIFLSIFNVHLQRSPIAGTVRSVEHRDGKFLMAMNPAAYMVNEQNIITIEGDKGTFVVRQIAGFLARRCVAWVKEGDVLAKGDKIGLIKFSSQVDVHFPAGVEIKIKKGDKVISGVTIIGVKA